MSQTSKILSNHYINKKRIKNGQLPANYLISRDGGINPKKMPNFCEKFGQTLSIYGQLPAEKAIAKLIGARFNYSKSLDLQLDKEILINVEKKIINDKSDIVFIHMKGPDEPGHDNKPIEKAIDILPYVLKKNGENK